MSDNSRVAMAEAENTSARQMAAAARAAKAVPGEAGPVKDYYKAPAGRVGRRSHLEGNSSAVPGKPPRDQPAGAAGPAPRALVASAWSGAARDGVVESGDNPSASFAEPGAQEAPEPDPDPG